jgi:hypothetical protein
VLLDFNTAIIIIRNSNLIQIQSSL